MSRPALTFQHLAVHRAAGVDRGNGFTLSGLCPGINLVHGPNGAGKTTTALALQELLWPGTALSGRPSAEGVFLLEGEKWRVDIEAGNPSWRREGRSAHSPEIGPAENRTRYYLALDDLIRERDADFAKQVANASRGGYDLRAAAEALGYRESPPLRSKQRRELETAQRGLHEAHRKQAELDREEQELKHLRQRKEQAGQAKQELECLRLVREYLSKDAEHRQIAAQLEAFPPEMAELRGDELELAKQLRKDFTDRQQQLEAQRKRLEDASQKAETCALPQDGPEQMDLDRMNGLCDRIETAEREARQQARERDKAARQREQLRERLGAVADEQRLRLLEGLEIGDLTGLARDYEKARARDKILHERRNWLSEPSPSDHSPETIQQGLTLLGNWLGRHNLARAERRRLPFLILAALLPLAPAIILFAAQHWAWLGLIPLAPLFLWLGERRARNAGRNAEEIREEYEALALPRPESWTAEGVLAAVDELQRQSAALRLHREKTARLDALATEEEEHARHLEDLEARRTELERVLGLRIGIGEEWLALFAESLARWQGALEELRAAQASLDTAGDQYSRSLQELNELLSPFDYSRMETAEGARAAVQDLARRREEREQARSEALAAERLIAESLRPGLEKIERDYRGIFLRLNLEEGDETTLSRWLQQREEYLRLAGELQKTQGSRDEYLRRLGGDPRLSQSLAEIEARIEEQEQLAAEHEGLVQRVATIERDLQRAKAGSEVSDALARVQEAEAKLADQCEQDSRAVVGHLLAEHVRRTAAERSRPGVFRSADALLSRITKGRLRLELEEQSDPAFLARDLVRNRVLQLDELSAGERVQLLLAVRLGFAEQQEQLARLPLLLDETLGNADDERAAAMIDALIRLARDGRQVFYFSAQADEIGKWLARLREEDADHALFDLQKLRRESERETIPLRIETPELAEIPHPEGASHAEYGRLLEVPGLDPLRRAPGETHLWHLVDDPEELYGLLRRGLFRAGQVQGLIESGGDALLPGAEWNRRFRARLRALEEAFANWLAGRDLPLDREVLQHSGAVSERFMDPVCELARRVGWDSGALLRGLQAGEVPRWKSAKTEQLREYLESEGYLDPGEPLDRETIRLNVLSRVADALSQGLLDTDWVDTLLARLPK
jgi:energy-coupling factor transporter ATP-binding protein EcfA2